MARTLENDRLFLRPDLALTYPKEIGNSVVHLPELAPVLPRPTERWGIAHDPLGAVHRHKGPSKARFDLRHERLESLGVLLCPHGLTWLDRRDCRFYDMLSEREPFCQLQPGVELSSSDECGCPCMFIGACPRVASLPGRWDVSAPAGAPRSSGSANTTHLPRGALLATTFTAVSNDIHGD